MLNISEVFSSVQGEGRFLGRPSTFLRLARCNLHCVWCDSAYTWRFSDKLPHNNPKVYEQESEIQEMKVDKVYHLLKSYPNRHVVITGGEPLLQAAELVPMLNVMAVSSERPWTIEFETAGTLSPVPGLMIKPSYTVSPKLENSGNSLKMRRRLDKLQELMAEDSVLKFVVTNYSDFWEIDELVLMLGVKAGRVYIMAEGTDAVTLNERTSGLMWATIDRGYNLTTRLQVLMYGNKRGV